MEKQKLEKKKKAEIILKIFLKKIKSIKIKNGKKN